ncbi:MAG: hypothetical protein IPJ61_09990 [Tessaracoccus sp.]|uniref:hypothetical protein n=1 Tax=Tessaracoccus sp. TaxID=1971211 RepID=UPI001ECE14DE|nr:hypothetical protein [Tessaracoccus sp.]MBK7821384.1 hypothetical protein [Tessaracoccus sp.]
MTVATHSEVVRSGGRRVAVSPSRRPASKTPVAHPQRSVAAGRVGKASSCVVAPSPQPVQWGLRLKVAAVGVIAVFGVAVCVPQIAAMAHPDPAREYVAGHPAWAHVDHP